MPGKKSAPVGAIEVAPVLRDTELRKLAGGAAFARGRDYWRMRRIHIDAQSAEALSGWAQGSRRYALWLRREAAGWRWDCACPAADDGSFCKHLVAAALTAREGLSPAQPESDRDADDPGAAVRLRQRPAVEADDCSERVKEVERLARVDRESDLPTGPGPGDQPRTQMPSATSSLAAFLHAQPAQRLAGWLLELAAEDGAIDKRLRLHQVAADPAQLKSAMGKLLSPGGFLDYRGGLRYALRLDGLVDALRQRLGEDPAHVRELCADALARLFKVYANSDDSAGAIGDRLGDLVALLVRSCVASPPPPAWAKTLHKLQRADDWSLLPLTDFWDVLGTQGQSIYAKRVLDAFASLPPPDEHSRYEPEVSATCRMTEALARASGDFDLLQRVLRRDLRYPVQYLAVLASLRAADRAREAQAWCEAAVRKFPRDADLREALAECLQDAGLEDEALLQSWQAFELQPGAARWDALKRHAAEAWPQWRERALAHVAALSHHSATQRIGLLLHDGDLAAAQALAADSAVISVRLVELARALQSAQPEAAGALYLRAVEADLPQAGATHYAGLVSLLQRASRLLPEACWQPALARIKLEYARRPKLMALLREAGM
jgi:tetratricopeptide (TPR) repeat protein